MKFLLAWGQRCRKRAVSQRENSSINSRVNRALADIDASVGDLTESSGRIFNLAGGGEDDTNLGSLIVSGLSCGARLINRCVEHRATLEIAMAYTKSLPPLH